MDKVIDKPRGATYEQMYEKKTEKFWWSKTTLKDKIWYVVR